MNNEVKLHLKKKMFKMMQEAKEVNSQNKVKEVYIAINLIALLILKSIIVYQHRKSHLKLHFLVHH
jgi:hypothetical protein